MKYLRPISIWLWWVFVATIPSNVGEIIAEFSAAFGCQQRAECYPNPPFASPFKSLDLLETEVALLLWPVCVWFVMFRPIMKLMEAVSPDVQEPAKTTDKANEP
jgi:hypothetical protein